MLIQRADVILPERIAPAWSVRTGKDCVEDVAGHLTPGDGEVVLDAAGFYLAPGFIDLHIHLGYLAPRLTFAEELSLCAECLPQNGTTRYLPTLVSALQGMLPTQFQAVRDFLTRRTAGAQPAGVHLEGPYIAPAAIGAFSPDQITSPDRFSMAGILDEGADLIRIMMVAPELPGAMPVIADLRERGIVAALGHTFGDQAIYEEARRAGAIHCTHTYNNRRTFPESPSGGRAFNLDDLAVADDDVTCELIADGVHVKPVWMKTIYRTKRAAKLSLITDSFLCGQRGAEGQCFEVRGGKRLTVRGGVGRDESGGLAGSVVTQDQALRTFLHHTGATLSDAVRSLTLSPARVVGLDDKLGSIESGKIADLVLLNRDLQPVWTMINGAVCWNNL
jgi:N-acetylglucosamine-6-phosphate deacetylase